MGGVVDVRRAGSNSRRLTTQVAGWLERELEPKGVGVVIEAEHQCMRFAGCRKPGSADAHLRPCAVSMREDSRTREEFLAVEGARRGCDDT